MSVRSCLCLLTVALGAIAAVDAGIAESPKPGQEVEALDNPSEGDSVASESGVDNPPLPQPGEWIKRDLPSSNAPCYGGCKHIRMAYNPRDRKIYVGQGDFLDSGTTVPSNPAAIASGRQEMYTYDVATDTWEKIQEYCQPGGVDQPPKPDNGPWVYDTINDKFWYSTGYDGIDGTRNGVADCPLPPTGPNAYVHDELWDWTPSGGWNLRTDLTSCLETYNVTSCSYTSYGSYDEGTTSIWINAWSMGGTNIIRRYNISTDTWSDYLTGAPGDGTKWNANYHAFDADNGLIYVATCGRVGSPNVNCRTSARGVLYSFDINRQRYANLGTLPAASGDQSIKFVWDSTNDVVIWPWYDQTSGSNRPINILVYDPLTGEWSDPGETVIGGVTPEGINAVYDPHNNVIMVIGGSNNSGGGEALGDLFLYRYKQDPGTPVDPPLPPSNLSAH